MDGDWIGIMAPILLYINAVLVLVDAILESKREKEKKEQEEQEE